MNSNVSSMLYQNMMMYQEEQVTNNQMFPSFSQLVSTSDEVDTFNDTMYDTEEDIELLPYKNFLNESRFWVQRVLVPIIMVIGVLGNTITIIIMTRRRMRSSTNNYLAALAIFDMLYLIMTFILSLKQYPNINQDKYYYYWSFCPFAHMITDCCSNSSVWLTVTFTIERFIVVSHPIKGKIICTESRSRKVILLVFTFCFIFVIPVPFEWQILESFDPITNITTISNEPSSLGRNELYKTIYYWLTTSLFTFIPLLLLTVFNSFLIRSVHISRKERSSMTGTSGHTGNTSSSSSKNISSSSKNKLKNILNIRKNNNLVKTTEFTTSCTESKLVNNKNINNENNSIEESISPKNINISSSTVQVKSVETSSSSSSSKQENKITIMLIAVVILFFICQFPTAIMLIIYTMYTPEVNSKNHYIFIGLNNIFNFLMALNSAGNFLLYCLFSQRYRRIFLNLFLPCLKSFYSFNTTTTGTGNNTTTAVSTYNHNNQSANSTKKKTTNVVINKSSLTPSPRPASGKRRTGSSDDDNNLKVVISTSASPSVQSMSSSIGIHVNQSALSPKDDEKDDEDKVGVIVTSVHPSTSSSGGVKMMETTIK